MWAKNLFFFNFLLILWEFPIMCPHPSHLSHPFLSILHPCSLSLQKKKIKMIEKIKHKNKKPPLHGSYGVSWCAIQSAPLPKQLHLQMLIARSHCSCSRPSASAILCNIGSLPGLLSNILLLSCVTEVLQVWSLLMLQQFLYGVDVQTGQFKALDLGLGGSWVGWPVCFLIPASQGQLSLCQGEE